jgi:5'-nucleotidase
MSKPKKILITNDDGYFSEGIIALAKELSKKHSVVTVAPDREQSASSHSLTLNHPLRLQKVGKNQYTTDGTPTDCVMLAVHLLFKHKKPDMIISGINHGGNMGDDVTYSGTIAAAIEGSILGVPSIAVSMANFAPGIPMIRAAKFTSKIVEIFKSLNLPSATFLNINFPIDNGKPYKKYEFSKLGVRKYKDIVISKIDPRGKPYYWIGGRPKWKMTKGTDFEIVSRGVVSISPLKINFTDVDVLQELKTNKIKI